MRHTTMAPAPQSHKFALKVGEPFPIVQTNPPGRFRNRVDSPVNWFAGSTIEQSNRRVCLPGAPLPTMTAKVPPHISSSVGIQSQARFFPCFVPAFPLEFRGTGESSREDSAARIEFAKPCSGTPQVVVALAAGDSILMELSLKARFMPRRKQHLRLQRPAKRNGPHYKGRGSTPSKQRGWGEPTHRGRIGTKSS